MRLSAPAEEGSKLPIMMRLPPPIWAMTFLALTAAGSWAAGWPVLSWLPHREAIGMAIFFAGGLLPVLGFRTFRLAGVELDPLSQGADALITSGPFRLSRNPMYLGVAVVTLGAAIWAGPWPMLLAPVAYFATVCLVHVPFEETKLRDQFGSDYDAYASRVRRWL